MDDEDLEQFGAKKIMEEDFESLGSTAKELERRKLKASGLSSVNDLIVYKNDSGDRIFRYLMENASKDKKKPRLVWDNPADKLLLMFKHISLESTHGRGYKSLGEPIPSLKDKKPSKKLDPGMFLMDSDEEEIYDYGTKSKNYENIIVDQEEVLATRNQKLGFIGKVATNGPPGFREGPTISNAPNM